MTTKLEAIIVDITKLDVDVIVNAANNSLLGGGGVDGAIHRAAGPDLLEECQSLDGCATGDAKITGGYDLPAKYIIHTVGPVWNGGSHGEESKLRSCYRRSLELAREYKLRTIAFPSISTGVYGYPTNLAAPVVIDECRNWINENPGSIDKIIFACFDEQTKGRYDEILSPK
jgi:O-acetyl-ADP-ribose deacetylase (regulator of RNase III)